MSLISVQIISTSTACDAESRAPCDGWGEVVPTVVKRVCCSSLLITADPGHPGAELRCCFISGRSGYWIFKREYSWGRPGRLLSVLYGRESSLVWLFTMGAAESAAQRDAASQEDASVSASAAELSAIQEGGGVLESKVRQDPSLPLKSL